MKIDFLGNELKIGDEVIFIVPGYRELTKGEVIRFTKCFVIVTYQSRLNKRQLEIKQTPNQLVRVPV